MVLLTRMRENLAAFKLAGKKAHIDVKEQMNNNYIYAVHNRPIHIVIYYILHMQCIIYIYFVIFLHPTSTGNNMFQRIHNLISKQLAYIIQPNIKKIK